MDPTDPSRGKPSRSAHWLFVAFALILLAVAGPMTGAAERDPIAPQATSWHFLPLVRKDVPPTATATPTASPTPTATATPTITPTPTTRPTPAGGMDAGEFGLVWVNSAEDPHGAARIARGADTGAQLDRFPLYWNNIETAPGQFTWGGQDAALAANESHGLGTLGILLGVPGFYYPNAPAAPVAPMPPIGGSFLRQAAVGPHAGTLCGPPPPRGLTAPVFSDGSDRPGPGKVPNPNNPWAGFVDRVVQRYRPGGTAGLHVSHWEIWNEPDLCQFWSGNATDYARLLKVAYLAIKNRDPQATVVWGGLAHFEQGQFLYDLINTLHADPLAAEYGGFFDAAGAHQYSIVWNSYVWTARVRSALDAVGWSNKPIWITESGVPICNDYPGPACSPDNPSAWRATPEEQAAYIWQNVAYTRLAGGGPIFQFNLHDDCGNVVAPVSPDGFGLVKNESTSYCSPAQSELRPAYTAFRLANQYFPGTEFLWSDVQQLGAGRARRVALYDPLTHERRMLVFALDAAAVVVTVPATGLQTRQVALNGSITPLNPINDQYQIALPGATNRNWPNSQGGYDIGIYGRPYLLLETDIRPPLTHIDALPLNSPPAFPVSWGAADLGSGVAAVDLYYSRDMAAWQNWLAAGPANGTATFHGEQGHHYRFAALGVDRAGNRATTPVTQAETWTTDQVPQFTVTGRVQNVQGQPAAGVAVGVGNAGTTTNGSGGFALGVTAGRWDVRTGGSVVFYGLDFSGDTNLTLLRPPAADAVGNGNFEVGLTGWQSGGSCPSAVEVQPGSDDHALHLATGFVANPGVPGEEGSAGGNSTVAQNLHVPAGHPYLALRYRVDSQETTAGHDKFEIIVVKNNQASYLNVSGTGLPWTIGSFDLSAFAGSDVTLIFNVYQSSPSRLTSAYVDWVTIGE